VTRNKKIEEDAGQQLEALGKVFQVFTEKNNMELTLNITLAGGEVLRDHFSFTPEQIDEWLKLTHKRAEVLREEIEKEKKERKWRVLPLLNLDPLLPEQE